MPNSCISKNVANMQEQLLSHAAARRAKSEFKGQKKICWSKNLWSGVYQKIGLAISQYFFSNRTCGQGYQFKLVDSVFPISVKADSIFLVQTIRTEHKVTITSNYESLMAGDCNLTAMIQKIVQSDTYVPSVTIQIKIQFSFPVLRCHSYQESGSRAGFP